jgi:hypothetical protein
MDKENNHLNLQSKRNGHRNPASLVKPVNMYLTQKEDKERVDNPVNLARVPIRVIIFEDNDRLRQSLTYLLQIDTQYEVLGDYNNCNDAVNITRVYEPM